MKNETENQTATAVVKTRFLKIVNASREFRYAGRVIRPSPYRLATGSLYAVHKTDDSAEADALLKIKGVSEITEQQFWDLLNSGKKKVPNLTQYVTQPATQPKITVEVQPPAESAKPTTPGLVIENKEGVVGKLAEPAPQPGSPVELEKALNVDDVSRQATSRRGRRAAQPPEGVDPTEE